MPRPRYRITSQDQYAAAQWIRGRLLEFAADFPTGDLTTAGEAQREFEALDRGDPAALQAWADRWLQEREWTQLKNAIRAQRKRERDHYRDKPKSIVLSHRAWYILSELARRDGVTLSQFIINQHDGELLRMEPIDDA